MILKIPNGPLRNRETYLQVVKRAVEINDTINGVKGNCCLNYLKYFNAVESTCIDYMHSLLERGMKNFFNAVTLNKVDSLIRYFVKEWIPLYPQSIMLSGVHEFSRMYDYFWTFKFI
jgi:hypothetical protein